MSRLFLHLKHQGIQVSGDGGGGDDDGDHDAKLSVLENQYLQILRCQP